MVLLQEFLHIINLKYVKLYEKVLFTLSLSLSILSPEQMNFRFGTIMATERNSA